MTRIPHLLITLWLVGAAVSAAAGGVSSSTTALVPQAASTSVSASTPLSSTAAISTALPPPAAVTTNNDDNGGNVVVQLFDWVKTSTTNFMDSCGTMWSNYGRCNEIRHKQNLYKKSLRVEMENSGMDSKTIRKQLQNTKGGISYEEYAFLNKGRQDRSKVIQLMTMSWLAPRFMPYAIMLFPEMLPSPFQDTNKQGSGTNSFQRHAQHAILSSLIQLEKDAHAVPALAKLNIFGRRSQERAMQRAGNFGKSLQDFLAVDKGPASLLSELKTLIHPSTTPPTRRDLSLVSYKFPKALTRGLSLAIEGRSPTLFDGILPTFVSRQRILAHVAKLTDSDDFLVSQKVNITKLPPLLLEEACRDRLLTTSSNNTQESRQQLQSWLNMTTCLNSETCNTNLARTALLWYNAMDGTRKDSASATPLTKSLYESITTTTTRPVLQQKSEGKKRK